MFKKIKINKLYLKIWFLFYWTFVNGGGGLNPVPSLPMLKQSIPIVPIDQLSIIVPKVSFYILLAVERRKAFDARRERIPENGDRPGTGGAGPRLVYKKRVVLCSFLF